MEVGYGVLGDIGGIWKPVEEGGIQGNKIVNVGALVSSEGDNCKGTKLDSELMILDGVAVEEMGG